MNRITDLDLTRKRVLVRADFNVPLDDAGRITDESRIRAVMPTISYIRSKNAVLVLASHLGRPKGKPDAAFSLKPVAAALSRILDAEVPLAADCTGKAVSDQIAEMNPGDVLLLENLRFQMAEQENDEAFARALIDPFDVYINDAFAVSHRKNASVHAVVRWAPEAAAGFLLMKELDAFQQAVENPERPLAAVIGGAKVSGKLEALTHLIERVDKLLIGGAMANTFLKSQGINVGRSKVETDLIKTANEVLKRAEEKGIKVYLPVDVVVADRIDKTAHVKPTPVQEIPEDRMAADVGPATSVLFGEALEDAKTIVWNGPLGVFEIDAFSRGTQAMVHAMARAHAFTVVGGGDTNTAVHNLDMADRFSYVSTGGGAFLQLMEGKPLPAVEALDAHPNKS
jgi:phosphoglycerate kinase